jgi:carbamate kinase
MKEIENKGYRRVVASPKPIDIVEKEGIEKLVNEGFVVITVGGGGIPVIEKQGEYIGVDAVIDKDYASALVASLLDADRLVVLTAVDKVYVNYAKPNQKALDVLTVTQAEEYIKQGQFGKGSMLPKIEAALSFVKRSKKPAVIASLENSAKALTGQSGTQIIL